MLPASQIRATVSDTSINEENRTVDLIWTTGSKGLRSSWGEQYYEELSLDPKHVDMTRLQDGAPVLAAHDSHSLDSVIGVVERANVDGKIGTATIRFAKDEYSERIFQKVKDKILRNVSVGYAVSEYTNVSEQGDEIPTYRATRWQPAELSIVPIGFDAGAKTRSNEVQTENEVELIEKTTENEVEAIERSEETKEEVQMTPEQIEQARLEAAKAERTRASGIRSAVKAAKLQDTLADDMVERGLSLEEATKNVEAFKRAIEASKKTEVENTVTVEVSNGNEEARLRGFEDALLTRVDGRHFKMTEEGKAFAGKSMIRGLELIIPRHNMESDVQYAKRAMSSSDLPLALANVAEKGLQKTYDLQPRTFDRWTRSETLNNYKEFSQVKTGDYASLLERPEGADAEESSFGEDKETAQLKDYARIVSFTSQMLVNDDMGVISRLASQQGVAISRLENRLAYAALTTNRTMNDGVALYHLASHGNLGTAGAISATTVAEAYKLMRKQASTDGLDKLNLTPKYFVCGPDKEVEARVFFSTIIPNQTSNVNIFQGSMEVIVDAELTGNQYYFLADPSSIDTVVCFRLAGQEQPKIESRVKFENSSLQLKIDHAFAAQSMDWRGIVKNAGN